MYIQHKLVILEETTKKLSLIQKTADLLSEDLQVETTLQGIDQMKVLQSTVQKIVEDMLVNDLQGFFNMVYRLDVGEEQVRNKLATCELSQASDEIAVLIIEREMKKVASRQKYQSQEQTDDPEAW